MQISRAVITAAGRGPRQYPAIDTVQKAMMPLVDRDGLTKPVLQIIAEEALQSGIEQIAVVCAPGDEAYYRHLFHVHLSNLRQGLESAPWVEEQIGRLETLTQCLQFVVQPEPDGYGHAVWCARQFTGDEPFLLLLSDHVYISHESRRCARQVIELATEQQCSVSAVHATREHLIHHYGTVGGKRVAGQADVYQIEEVIEKPTLTVAELKLQVPGLRTAHYLCFFGMHVLTPRIMGLLDELVRDQVREAGQIQLSTALNRLARDEKYLAAETRGSRHNLGVRFGMVEAQVALALSGGGRENMLALLLGAVARVDQTHAPS